MQRDAAEVAETFREAIQDRFFHRTDANVRPADGGGFEFDVATCDNGGTFTVTVKAAG